MGWDRIGADDRRICQIDILPPEGRHQNGLRSGCPPELESTFRVFFRVDSRPLLHEERVHFVCSASGSGTFSPTQRRVRFVCSPTGSGAHSSHNQRVRFVCSSSTVEHPHPPNREHVSCVLEKQPSRYATKPTGDTERERVHFVCSHELRFDLNPDLKSHSARLFGDLFPSSNDDVRVEIQFVLVVLAPASTLIPFVPDEEPEHVEIREMILHALQRRQR